MPRIHTYAIPVFLDPIPYDIPRPVEIQTRPGRAAASVLFHARQFPPLIIRTISSAPDKITARSKADTFLRLVRRRVLIDDGTLSAAQTVVISVVSTFSDGGLIIGGSAAGDRIEIASTWAFLLDADQDQR